jgi:LPXTG-motif cell wall-anchored protein
VRRWLLILPLLLLTAPAVAHAGGLATTRLSSTPAGLRAGRPWKVELAILRDGRTPLTGLRPAVVAIDADGNRTTFHARPTGTAGHYAATVRFPKPGQWSYAVYDGFDNALPTTYPAVVIRPTTVTTTTRRPDPVGPPGLPIAFAGLLLLGAAGFWLARRRRHPPARLA